MTQIVNDRALAVKVGYEATDWTRHVDEHEYREAVADWDVKALIRGSECIGAVYRRGEELHVSILPEWRKRWATKGLLRELFGNLPVRTKVTPGHEYMHDILRRLGFVQLDSGEFVKGH